MQHKRIWRNICRQNWKRDLRIFSDFLAWHSNRTFRWSWWHAYEHTLPQSSEKKNGMRWKCLHLGLRISLGLSTFHPTNWLSQWIHVKFSRFPSCPSTVQKVQSFRSLLFSAIGSMPFYPPLCLPFCSLPCASSPPKIHHKRATFYRNPHNHVAATKFHFVSISSGLPNFLILKALRNGDCVVMDKTKNTSPHFDELAICYLLRKYTRNFHFTAYAATQLSYKYITPRWTRVCLSFKNTTVYTHLMQTENSWFDQLRDFP